MARMIGSPSALGILRTGPLPLIKEERLMKTAKYSRRPTQQELADFKGMHCKNIYLKAVATGWHCPCCNRNAQELVRWTDIRVAGWQDRYAETFGMGFTVTFAHHHCHKVSRPRFPRALICGDCNSADGAAKRVLKLPEDWSFTPQELSQFVRVKAHSGHTEIDYDVAKRLYSVAMVPAELPPLPVRFW